MRVRTSVPYFLRRLPLLRRVSRRGGRLRSLVAGRVEPRRWAGIGSALEFAQARGSRLVERGLLGQRSRWRPLFLLHRRLSFVKEEPGPARAGRALGPAERRARLRSLGPPVSAPPPFGAPRALLAVTPIASAPLARVRGRLRRAITLPDVRGAAPPDTSAPPVPAAQLPPSAVHVLSSAAPSRAGEEPAVMPHRRSEAVHAPEVLPRPLIPPALTAAPLERRPALPEQVERVVYVGPTVGEPLSPELRRVMRHRLGFDPERVRIHRGESVHHAAKALGASAFTLGEHVYFARDRFQPETPAGRDLIAHELVHVRQQPGGRPFRPGQLSPARQATLEAEAGRPAPAPAAPPRLVLAPVAPGGPAGTPVVPLLADEAATPTVEPGAPSPPPGPPAAAPPPLPPPPDHRDVAEHLYRLLERDLRLERERTGVQQWHH